MPIDSKILEEFLISKSLGMLSPEADILLADYLEQHPEAEPLARCYDEVIDLSRKAFGSDEAVTLPAFPAKGIRRAAAMPIWKRRIKKVSAVAAALAVGFLLGMPFGKSPSPTTTIEFVSVQPSAGEQKETRSEPEDSFWSIDLASLREDGGRKRSSSRLIWKSITQRPEIGGEL